MMIFTDFIKKPDFLQRNPFLFYYILSRSFLQRNPERTAEIKTLKIGPWIKDRILLVDLGFYKNQMFPRVEENGGYFVSRIKKNIDPIVVSIEEGIPKTKCKEFVGKPISECIQQLSGKDVDAVVKISFKRRKYKGKQKKDEMLVRLVAL
jgi:putative transposase